MYKDIKNGGSGKRRKKSIGLEIIENGDNYNLRKGDIIPISNELTIGRNTNNLLKLSDKHASSYHAKIFLKNRNYILEDIKSTNGTLLNYELIRNKEILEIGDEIQIGTSIFKVIG